MTILIHKLTRLLAPLALGACLVAAPPAVAGAPAPAWTVTTQYDDLAPGDSSGGGGFFITATNTGAAPTDGSPVTLTDTLPSGLTVAPVGPSGGGSSNNERFSCSAGPPATCTDSIEPVVPGDTISMWVPVNVSATPPLSVANQVSVSGGGAATASATSQTPISALPSGFGLQNFDGATTGPDGSAVTQAGSHPYELRSSLTLNAHFEEQVGAVVPRGDPKDLTVNLPAGLVVNPNATPVKCTESQLENVGIGVGCPAASAVGTIALIIGTLPGGIAPAPSVQSSPIYNMVAPPGVPAALGFNAAGLGIYEHLLGGVRTGGDYGLSANLQDLPQRGVVLGAIATLWGNPSDPSHDRMRCFFGGIPCSVPATNTAFLTLPGACSGPLTTTISADSWQQPGTFLTSSFESHDTTGNPVGIDGCGKLAFTPSISVRPDTSVADSPAGLSVELRVPQEGLTNPNGLAEADLKRAVVTLPRGMSVNPSAVNGLAGCSEAQIGLHNANEPSCPDASKIGTAEVSTPLLNGPLKGGIYVAQQGNLAGNGSNPFGSLLAIYVTAEADGALVKLAGKVVADPVTGQLRTTFDNNPQLPFSDLKLEFFGGPRGALVNPDACGSYTAVSQLTPWSSETPAEPLSGFEVNEGCHAAQFNPSFLAGTSNPQAGAFSAFSVSFSRSDQDQGLGAVSVQLPPGLLGLIKGMERCPEPQAGQGACGPGSLVGHISAAAGAGPDPVSIQGGQVFLTGPYKGAPFGLSIAVPAVAGPFNLGTVVVRAAIGIDPHTAQITVVSDPLPTILQGIPLLVKKVNVTVDRPGFTFNPTSCNPLTVGGTLTSTQGTTAGVSAHFQAANCAALSFHPSFIVSTQARTSRAGGASLDVKVASGAGQANIGKVAVSLPKQLPSRLTTIQQACPEATFNANPASCPAGSNIGVATATTPVLANAVTGPAYLVSHGGAAFPDIVVILQGEGLTVQLTGSIDIKKGVTSSAFNSVPDVPISAFDLNLPQGPHSALATNLPAKAKGNLCGQTLTMPTTITGQNGAQITQSTKIKVSGCPKAKRKHKAKHRKAKAKKGSLQRRK